jgi:DNA-binding winged helix-turn-helix (wHTH) protein
VPRPLSISDPIRLRFDDFELDEANAWLLRGGKAVALAPTPFSLLCALARQPDALLTKDALLDAVWGHRFVTESVLKTCAPQKVRLAQPRGSYGLTADRCGTMSAWSAY